MTTRICPTNRCWAWATTCEHEAKLRTVRDGRTGWECDKCDSFWSDEFLDTHPSGSHNFIVEIDSDWLQCEFCKLQRSRRPVM